MLLRKQIRNQEIKGYEGPVSNDWDIIQLARFPDESRKRTHIPDDGWVYAQLKETDGCSQGVEACCGITEPFW